MAQEGRGYLSPRDLFPVLTRGQRYALVCHALGLTYSKAEKYVGVGQPMMSKVKRRFPEYIKTYKAYIDDIRKGGTTLNILRLLEIDLDAIEELSFFKMVQWFDLILLILLILDQLEGLKFNDQEL